MKRIGYEYHYWPQLHLTGFTIFMWFTMFFDNCFNLNCSISVFITICAIVKSNRLPIHKPALPVNITFPINITFFTMCGVLSVTSIIWMESLK